MARHSCSGALSPTELHNPQTRLLGRQGLAPVERVQSLRPRDQGGCQVDGFGAAEGARLDGHSQRANLRRHLHEVTAVEQELEAARAGWGDSTATTRPRSVISSASPDAEPSVHGRCIALEPTDRGHHVRRVAYHKGTWYERDPARAWSSTSPTAGRQPVLCPPFATRPTLRSPGHTAAVGTICSPGDGHISTSSGTAQTSASKETPRSNKPCASRCSTCCRPGPVPRAGR